MYAVAGRPETWIRRNWTLGALQSGGIDLEDCRVGPPEHAMEIRKNRIDPRIVRGKEMPVYPAVRMRRTLRVQVVDEKGEPVQGAAWRRPRFLSKFSPRG